MVMVKRIWITWSKRLEIFVKLMSKNSISGNNIKKGNPTRNKLRRGDLIINRICKLRIAIAIQPENSEIQILQWTTVLFEQIGMLPEILGLEGSSTALNSPANREYKKRRPGKRLSLHNCMTRSGWVCGSKNSFVFFKELWQNKIIFFLRVM
jgi:hypothetical protein